MFARTRHELETDNNLISTCYTMFSIREDTKWLAFAVREATALVAMLDPNTPIYEKHYQRILEFVHSFMRDNERTYYTIYPQDTHCMREWLAEHPLDELGQNHRYSTLTIM